MGGDFDHLKKMLIAGKLEKENVRFFVGYSGWSADQLQSEIEGNSWFVTNVDKETVMNTDIEDLWKVIMKQQGRQGELIANLPEDPSLN